MTKWLYLVIAIVMALSAGETMAVTVSSQTIYIFRHAEKVPDKPDPELSDKGIQRAHKLAEALRHSGIERVYATKYKRTQQTAKPLAQALGLAIVTYPAGDAVQLINQVRQDGATTLIIGHSNTVPDLVRAAGGEAHDLTEKDYGDLFQVVIEHDANGTMSVITTVQSIDAGYLP